MQEHPHCSNCLFKRNASIRRVKIENTKFNRTQLLEGGLKSSLELIRMVISRVYWIDSGIGSEGVNAYLNAYLVSTVALPMFNLERTCAKIRCRPQFA